jgi:nickel superoxide dismutase
MTDTSVRNGPNLLQFFADLTGVFTVGSPRGRSNTNAVCLRARNDTRAAISMFALTEDRMRLPSFLAPHLVVRAHCDLPCGVYDPAQARIEAESIKAIAEKYQANEDPEFRTRALIIKEQRSELVKHHLWVLWTDYFKPPHFDKYPQLHQLVNEATKLAGASGTKGSVDPQVAQDLLDKIDEIAKIFWETKQG